MVMVNAKQRTEKEWGELLTQADVGLKVLLAFNALGEWFANTFI
jgi:hypothetical protein